MGLEDSIRDIQTKVDELTEIVKLMANPNFNHFTGGHTQTCKEEAKQQIAWYTKSKLPRNWFGTCTCDTGKIEELKGYDPSPVLTQTQIDEVFANKRAESRKKKKEKKAIPL